MIGKMDATKVMLYLGAGLIAVILGVSLSLLIFNDPNRRGDVIGEALIGGPFEMVDQNGQLMDESMLQGKLNLVYFGYTYCPDFCPTELGNLAAAKKKLAENGVESRIVFFTIDPERDTPEALKEYLSYFDDAAIGLSGSIEQVKQAANAYRVVYRKVEDDDYVDGYVMDHSTFVYAMGPDGKFITHFAPETAPSVIAEKLAPAS